VLLSLKEHVYLGPRELPLPTRRHGKNMDESFGEYLFCSKDNKRLNTGFNNHSFIYRVYFAETRNTGNWGLVNRTEYKVERIP